MTSQETTLEDTGPFQWSTSFHRQIYFSDKGGFPLSRNFYDRKHVNFTRVNKINAMYEMLPVNAKVVLRSTFKLRTTFHTLPLFHLCA